MKKLLLSVFAATAAFAAYAAPTQVWTKSVDNAFSELSVESYNAAVAVDTKGAVIATGAYTQDLSVAGATLEAVGTSAYIVKYSAAGDASWAVGIVGSASITKVVTDADDNIYVAGQYADEISFGTTSGEAVVRQGMTVDGDPGVEPTAAFVAKYDAQGKLLAVRTFVPELQPALVNIDPDDLAFYMYSDGDVYFRLTDMKICNDKLYLAVVYLGITVVDEIKFDASYVNYMGFMYCDNKSASVFTLDSSLENAALVDQIGSAVNDGAYTENTYEVWSARFDVRGEDMVVAYVGTGDLKYQQDELHTIVDENDNVKPYFVFSTFKNGSFVGKKVMATDDAMISTFNSVSGVSILDAGAVVTGDKYTKTVPEGADESAAVYSNDLFVVSIPALDVNNAEMKVVPVTEGNFFYLSKNTACLPDGDILVATRAYYLNAENGHLKNELAGEGTTFIVAANEVDKTDYKAADVAATGSCMAISQISETGASFTLYNDPDAAGITDIVADENAPVEYFNLQGVRVANPENGLYIVRQGNKVTKQILK